MKSFSSSEGIGRYSLGKAGSIFKAYNCKGHSSHSEFIHYRFLEAGGTFEEGIITCLPFFVLYLVWLLLFTFRDGYSELEKQHSSPLSS